MSVYDLLQWWNLIFALPFVAAVLQTLLQAVGVLHLGHIGHGIHLHHAHVDHHVQVGHSVHTAHGAQSQSGHDHNAGHHADTGHQPGLGSRIMGGMFNLLGLGRAPFMVVLSSFFLVWGLVGLTANQVLGVIFPPQLFIAPAMLSALLTASIFTGLMARGIARLMPMDESYETSLADLAGTKGKVILPITAKEGVVAIINKYHDRIEVKCRTEGDEVIPVDTEVILLCQDIEDDETHRYFVMPFEEGHQRLDVLNRSLLK